MMAMVESATVLFNPKKREGAGMKREVEKFLLQHGVKLREKGEMVIAIGGDGTILYNKRYYDRPIFGIGGELSFLCQATMKNWRGRLGRVLKGYRTDKRMMLASELDGKRLPDALNEVCIRRRMHRVLRMKLAVAGRRYALGADGVIFSTPTGSTAYAYSCGGKELQPHARRYGIAAIAPLRRGFKPLVVGENMVSRLLVEEGGENTDVIIDGQLVFPMKKRSRVKVYKSGEIVRFVRAK
jgi:NAD+ kinase